MPNLLIRDVDKATIRKLKARAADRGCSLQVELKEILERSAGETTNNELHKRAVAFSKRFEGRQFSDSAELLREDRRR